MNLLSICALLIGTSLLLEQVQSESEKCIKEMLPMVRSCDAEIAKIDSYCIQGYRKIDRICQGNDSEDCAIKYKSFEAACKLKRKVFKKKCKAIYKNYKRECGGTPTEYYQKVGPDSYRCLKVLTPAVEVCDKKISKIDKLCNKKYQIVNAECKGKDTDECGMKYNNVKSECQMKRQIFFKSCGSTYRAYKTECKGKSAIYPPPTGPESDRCLKQLVPAVQNCDIDIGKIDKYCIEEYKSIDEACKGKDSDECILKYKNIKIICTKKRNNFLEKCSPIYKAYKTECKGESVVIAPLFGPESDRCMKELIPAMKICDKRINKIDKYCVEGYRKIDNECKGQDTDACGLKYKQFKIICQKKLQKNSKVCVVINKAYKTECTGLSAVSTPYVGPNFLSCSNELIPAIDICDEEIANLDESCSLGFEAIDAKCRDIESVECGRKYMRWTETCKVRREDFWNVCGLIYNTYIKGSAAVRAISVKSVETVDFIDIENEVVKRATPVPKKRVVLKKPAAPGKPISSKKPVAPGKPISSKKPAAPGKPISSKKPAAPGKPISSKKPASLGKPISTKKPVRSAKRISTIKPSAPKKPATVIKPGIKPVIIPERYGQEISTCSQTLIRATWRCDINSLKIDKYCSGKYKIINRACEKMSETDCGTKYKRLTTICRARRDSQSDKCEPIYDEYHEQCEGLCPQKK